MWESLTEFGNFVWMEATKIAAWVISIYIVVNPAGASSVFLGLTKDATPAERFGIALRACVTGALILFIFGLSGTFFFKYLRIAGWSLRVAGGIIMFAFAMSLVRGREKEFFGASDPDGAAKAKHNIAYYPLAVPLIASPASITLVITLSPAGTDTLAQFALLVSITLVCGICFLNMMRLGWMLEKKGPGLSLIMPRLWGLLLAIISVQFIYEGVREILPALAEAWHKGTPPAPS
ncbi:MAG: MarC family protein [Planctomycetota bacterium]|jgi:multiple antibiotic resistance protein